MKRIRFIGTSIALGGVLLLGGCVGVPGPAYDGGYYGGGYSEPYYGSGAVVVNPAPVYIEGGSYYGRPGYYGRPVYQGRPGYNGRPDYSGRPAYNNRPGYAAPRPIAVPPQVRPSRPAVRPVVPVPNPGWHLGSRPGNPRTSSPDQSQNDLNKP